MAGGIHPRKKGAMAKCGGLATKQQAEMRGCFTFVKVVCEPKWDVYFLLHTCHLFLSQNHKIVFANLVELV
jgi:hypothetical protein